MTFRVVLIGAAEQTGTESLAALLRADGDVSFEVAAWTTYRFDANSAQAHLLMPVALDGCPPAVAFFENLHRTRFPLPSLAIVGDKLPEAFLRTVILTADDFIIAPVREAEFRERVRRLIGKDALAHSVEKRLLDEAGLNQLVGGDPVFLDTIRNLVLFARSEAPVLITGETGTGKELCARAIHHLSKRRNFPFIPVDCSALPDHLFENELFGHSRGAYTDAHTDQKGLVAMAEGGTLFLDEIDSLSQRAQAKLLRFLQERSYKPLGADRFHRADVNVIAATNAELAECVRRKEFRTDLYFRLNVLQLRLPALRDRRHDIERLAMHFLRALVPQSSAKKSLSASALRKLASYAWPGNVRELMNVIHRAAVLCEQSLILPAHIHLPVEEQQADLADASFRRARTHAIEVFERSFIEDLLTKHAGNISRAAIAAGQERRAFGRLVKKYQLRRTTEHS